MAGPEAALHELVAVVRADGTLISAHTGDSEANPALGRLAAAGPRAAAAPGEYALLFEAIREGYLLHYGNPRIIHGVDADLALLAGDYLYATGLERLAALGDPEAVSELSDLISLSAQVHAEGDAADQELVAALWLASATALGAGRSDEHDAAKRAAREGADGAAASLWQSAQIAAALHSIESELEAARETIGFAAHDRG
ncbi:MAG: hypothetical protein QOD60_591 [Solirubrobacterales bacterium]|jgi:hypothetical protein|nr:hypothetical protein [Solirubrobacterales bacterium]